MANIGEPMRRHHVIPLDHPIPATTEPNPSSLPATALGESRIRAGEIIGWRYWKRNQDPNRTRSIDSPSFVALIPQPEDLGIH
jgi:hypothetical protein